MLQVRKQGSQVYYMLEAELEPSVRHSCGGWGGTPAVQRSGTGQNMRKEEHMTVLEATCEQEALPPRRKSVTGKTQLLLLRKGR